eukprot:m.1823 g.1823  ORF g.1823 m.1823 type:complete len:1406 (+) comp1634_c0_seq1:59-4276(+)
MSHRLTRQKLRREEQDRRNMDDEGDDDGDDGGGDCDEELQISDTTSKLRQQRKRKAMERNNISSENKTGKSISAFSATSLSNPTSISMQKNAEEVISLTLEEIQVRAGRMSIPLTQAAPPDHILQQLLDESVRPGATHRYAIVRDVWKQLGKFEEMLPPDSGLSDGDPASLTKHIQNIQTSTQFQLFRKSYLVTLQAAVDNLIENGLVDGQEGNGSNTPKSQLDKFLEHIGSSTGWGLLPPPKKLQSVVRTLAAETAIDTTSASMSVPSTPSKMKKASNQHTPTLGGVERVSIHSKAKSLKTLHGCSFDEIMSLQDWAAIKRSIEDMLLSSHAHIAKAARDFLLHSVSPSNSMGYVELLHIYCNVLKKCQDVGSVRPKQFNQDAHIFTQLLNIIPKLWLRYTHATMMEIAQMVVDLFIISDDCKMCLHREVANLDPHAEWFIRWTSSNTGRSAILAGFQNSKKEVLNSVVKHFFHVCEHIHQENTSLGMKDVFIPTHLDVSVASIICQLMLSHPTRSLFPRQIEGVGQVALCDLLVCICKLCILEAHTQTPSPIVSTARQLVTQLFLQGWKGQRDFLSCNALWILLESIPTSSTAISPTMTTSSQSNTCGSNDQKNSIIDGVDNLLAENYGGIIPLVIDTIGVASSTVWGREVLRTKYATIKHVLLSIISAYTVAVISPIPPSLASSTKTVSPKQSMSHAHYSSQEEQTIIHDATIRGRREGGGGHIFNDHDVAALERVLVNALCTFRLLLACKPVPDLNPYFNQVQLYYTQFCSDDSTAIRVGKNHPSQVSHPSDFSLSSRGDALQLMDGVEGIFLDAMLNCASFPLGAWVLLNSHEANIAIERLLTNLLCNAQVSAFERYGYGCVLVELVTSRKGCACVLKSGIQQSLLEVYQASLDADMNIATPPYSKNRSKSRAKALSYITKVMTMPPYALELLQEKDNFLLTLLKDDDLTLYYLGSVAQAERDSITLLRFLLSSLTTTCQLIAKHDILQRIVGVQKRDLVDSTEERVVLSEFSILRNSILAHALVVGGPSEKAHHIHYAPILGYVFDEEDTLDVQAGLQDCVNNPIPMITDLYVIPQAYNHDVVRRTKEDSVDNKLFSAFCDAIEANHGVEAAFWQLMECDGGFNSWACTRSSDAQDAFLSLVQQYMPIQESHAKELKNNDDCSPFWITTTISYGHRLGLLSSDDDEEEIKWKATLSEIGSWQDTKKGARGSGAGEVENSRNKPTDIVGVDWFLSAILYSSGVDHVGEVVNHLHSHKKRICGVWTNLDEGVRMYKDICQQVTHACEEHVPLAATAIRLAGLTISHICSLWLEQSFINFLNWQQIYLFICGTIIYGDEFAIAMCTSILKERCPLILSTPSSSLDFILRTSPMTGFSFSPQAKWMQHMIEKKVKRKGFTIAA